jgi:hypothetical protein
VADPEFADSVFINCPFDQDYAPILQGILFCIIFIGLRPRIATESSDSGKVRLNKISGLIENSRYSIHDLSRIKAKSKDEFFRLNMPFELGLDYGCRQYYGHGREAKSMLILESTRYEYQAAISDLAGCDVEAHGGDFETAVRKVRNWLRSEAKADAPGAARIISAYLDFQGWNYARLRGAGFDATDIEDYPTAELLDAMKDWMVKGQPL